MRPRHASVETDMHDWTPQNSAEETNMPDKETFAYFIGDTSPFRDEHA